MKYLLDTDTCIYVINERPRRVLDRFRKHSVGDVGISSITASELAFGVAKSGSAKNRAALEGFMLPRTHSWDTLFQSLEQFEPGFKLERRQSKAKPKRVPLK